jgi:hypothetical protein
MSQGPIIKAADRVLVIGFTGSGKTQWIQAHARGIRGQLLVIDVKGDIFLRQRHVNCYTIAQVRATLRKYKEAKTAEQAAANRVIRFVWPDGQTDAQDQVTMNELFGLVYATKDLRWWLDEAIGLTGPNTIAARLKDVLTRGRSRGQGGFAAAQAPVGFTPYLRNQADHVVIFAQRWSTRHLTDLATELGYDSPRQLRDELMALNRQYGDLGKYSHIHFERANGKLWARPPLPGWMLKL